MAKISDNLHNSKDDGNGAGSKPEDGSSQGNDSKTEDPTHLGQDNQPVPPLQTGKPENMQARVSQSGAQHRQACKPPKAQPSQGPWMILGMDIMEGIRHYIFAISVTVVFIVINVARWTFTLIRHINNSPNSPNVTLAQVLMRHQRAGKTPVPHIIDYFSWTGRIWHLIRSLFFVHGLWVSIVYALLFVVILSVTQTRLGVLKTIVINLVSTLTGTVLGIFLCLGINLLINDWRWVQSVPLSLAPLTLVIGGLLAASAYEDVLWRRRIILITYATIFAILLFGGNPGIYCTLCAAFIGHIIGLIIHGPTTERVQWWRGTDYEIRRLYASIQLVLAVGPILAMTSKTHAGPLTNLALFISPSLNDNAVIDGCLDRHSKTSCTLLAEVHHLAMSGIWIRALLPIFALSVVAWGLYRGRRLAVWVSIILNSTIVLFAVVYYLITPLTTTAARDPAGRPLGFGVDFLSIAIPPLILVLLLIKNLPHFSIHVTAKQIRYGVTAIIATLLAITASYVAVGMLMLKDFKPNATISSLLLSLLHLLMPMGFADEAATIRPLTPMASLMNRIFVAIFWIVVFLIFFLWFRDTVAVSSNDRVRANRLVEQGGSSMSFMTTWENNHYWFSPSGRSGIAYRLVYGIALTVTGPFGDPHEYASDLREFIRFCEQQSWSPAFYAVHEEQRDELKKLGCTSIQVGTEMVVEPNAWQTHGKKWQDIRTAINKAKRDGITDVLSGYDRIDWRARQQIVDISEQWAQLKALPEMKFTLGGLEELRDPRVVLLYAQDRDGNILGVTSWLPTYRQGRVVGWTLDFMRHSTDSPNGIMEFLIARLAERLRDLGEQQPQNAVEFMSLSAAPLAGIGQDSQNNASGGAEIIEHGLEIVADILEPAYGFKSLFFFKKKFQPTPTPIYMSYSDSARLAQIGLAVVSAYLPELKPRQIANMLRTLKPARSENRDTDRKAK